MSNYTKNTSFTPKDSLVTGNPSKKILGADLDGEFDEIATSIATKLDTPSTASAKAAIALPSASAFYATTGVNQTGVLTGDPTRVEFTTESYDYGSEFSGSSFVAGAAGIYTMSSTVVLSTNLTAGTTVQIWFSRAGTAVAGTKMNVGGSVAPILNLSWIGAMTFGQQMDVYILHNLGSSVTIVTGGSAGVTMWSGARIA